MESKRADVQGVGLTLHYFNNKYVGSVIEWSGFQRFPMPAAHYRRIIVRRRNTPKL